MATTQEVVRQLYDYAEWRSTQACDDIRRLYHDGELSSVVDGATNFEQGWRKVRTFVKTGTTAPPPTVKKMTTREYRNRVQPMERFRRFEGESLMCWEASLEAFGIRERTGKGEFTHVTLGHIKEAGYATEKVKDGWHPKGVTPTLAVFMASHLEGDWIVFMPGHVAVIRDGVITDTTGKHATVKRTVIEAYQVISPVLPRGHCPCTDVAVFGHTPGCHLAGFRPAELDLAATAQVSPQVSTGISEIAANPGN